MTAEMTFYRLMDLIRQGVSPEKAAAIIAKEKER